MRPRFTDYIFPPDKNDTLSRTASISFAVRSPTTKEGKPGPKQAAIANDPEFVHRKGGTSVVARREGVRPFQRDKGTPEPIRRGAGGGLATGFANAAGVSALGPRAQSGQGGGGCGEEGSNGREGGGGPGTTAASSSEELGPVRQAIGTVGEAQGATSAEGDGVAEAVVAESAAETLAATPMPAGGAAAADRITTTAADGRAATGLEAASVLAASTGATSTGAGVRVGVGGRATAATGRVVAAAGRVVAAAARG